MLELRPICEHCAKALLPNALDARICSYECTFCATCVDSVLGNVCPNCGGGFAPRPIRPVNNLIGGNFLKRHPASQTLKHKPIDAEAHAAFTAGMRAVAPENR